MAAFVKLIFLPLLLITAFCFGMVEWFYFWLETRLTAEVRSPLVASVSTPVLLTETTAEELAKRYDSSIIVDRNLFAARTEADEERSSFDFINNLEPSSLDVVLMGTVSGTDGAERAIIYDRNERKQELYRTGDYIQQAVIRKILRGKVILNFDGKDEILDIAEARNVVVSHRTIPDSAVPEKAVTVSGNGRSVPGNGPPADAAGTVMYEQIRSR